MHFRPLFKDAEDFFFWGGQKGWQSPPITAQCTGMGSRAKGQPAFCQGAKAVEETKRAKAERPEAAGDRVPWARFFFKFQTFLDTFLDHFLNHFSHIRLALSAKIALKRLIKVFLSTTRTKSDHTLNNKVPS